MTGARVAKPAATGALEEDDELSKVDMIMEEKMMKERERMKRNWSSSIDLPWYISSVGSHDLRMATTPLFYHRTKAASKVSLRLLRQSP